MTIDKAAELRKNCLELALQTTQKTGGKTLEIANQYWDFVKGEDFIVDDSVHRTRVIKGSMTYEADRVRLGEIKSVTA